MQPDSPKFNAPPLLCVVFSVHFEQFEEISKYLPGLITSLAAAGLTDFQNTHLNSFDFQLAEEKPEVSWKQKAQYDFASKDRKTLVRINESSCSIHFADYCHFGPKKPQIEGVLEALTTSIPDLKATRYSLRYINHISLEPSGNLLDWVHHSMLGLPNQPDFALERVGSNCETVFKSGTAGQLIFRCSTFPGGLTIPPDLAPISLTFFAERISKTPFIRLENTHLQPAEGEFNAANGLDQLSKLRAAGSSLFRDLTTPKAHEIWQRS